ncbi:hypothetical protein LNTAR_09124 [Lentisphaera araneosa HTCC2155]|uniref:Uncharacterized protein n=1 Tax=Lentisphaera araneosa HTCC2155 TaxID=313628 RepID=A6DI66_9BACT|nr:hypothetical protein LNTAR_09124 [Lentisphaera araneosa HTCC2155]
MGENKKSSKSATKGNPKFVEPTPKKIKEQGNISS